MQNKGAYAWNFGGRILPQLIYLVTNILLAHYITPAEFGQIGVLAIFISISSTLTDAGFGGSIIKEQKVEPIDLSTVFVYNLVVSIGLYLVLYIISPLIEQYFNIEGLCDVARVLGLVFVINAWTLIPKTILIRELKFKSIAKVAILGVCIASVVSIYGALKGWGVYALVSYQIVYTLSDVICFEILTKYRHSLKFSLNSFKRLFSFGFYTTLCNVIEAGYTNVMTTLFGKFMNINAAGYLYQAQKLETSATNSLAATINTVSFPILTKLRNDREIFIAEANSLYRNFALYLFPLFWIVVVYSKVIIVLLFGKEWQESAIYLSILMIIGVFYVMESLTRNYIKSLGEVKELAKYTLVKRIIGLIFILGFLFIGPFYMLYGYLLSTIFGYLINTFLFGKVLNIRILKILKDNLKPLAFTLIFLLGLGVSHQIGNLAIELIIGLILVVIYYVILLPKVSGVNLLNLISKGK